jgi:glycosyltransferase involved in cell wall biosynthesis
MARKVASLGPVLRIIPRPDRPQGLSAIVRLKDEEEWLEPCILSISEAADEIIAGDNGSTDSSPEILKRLRGRLGGKLKVLDCPGMGIRDLTNHLIDNTSFRWIIRWDADFVARTDGDTPIQMFTEWLFSLDPRRYYLVYPLMVELHGDLFHQRPETLVRRDCHCFTTSGRLRYVYNRSGLEAPRTPKWYMQLLYNIPTFFHVDVKPAVRMFRNHLWKTYLEAPDRHDYPGFDTWIMKELEEKWGGMSAGEAADAWLPTRLEGLVPYNRDRYGDYPSILEPFVREPRYRIRYEGNTIAGRDELV